MNSTPELQNSALHDDIPNKILFRPDETAVIFDVSIRTIYLWVEEGKLDAIRPNKGIIRIFRRSILSLLRNDQQLI